MGRILLSLPCLSSKIGWRRLAAVGVENYEEDQNLCHKRQFGNISANESHGDPLRHCITIGWSFLWRLGDIAWKVVREMTENNVSGPKKSISSMTRGFHSVQKLEAMIKRQHLECISNPLYCGHRELHGYHMMHGIISSTFADRVFDDPRGKTSNWRTGNEFSSQNSWLNWLVLRGRTEFLC